MNRRTVSLGIVLGAIVSGGCAATNASRRYDLEMLAFETILRKTPNIIVMDDKRKGTATWIAKLSGVC